MKTNPFKQSPGITNASGPREVTQTMVEDRAGALAMIKGRYARDVTESDLTDARRELTNEAAGKA